MKTELWAIGKTNEAYLQEGMDIYLKRLKHYLSFKMEVIPDLKKSKNWSPAQFKLKEGQLILQKLMPGDHLILLDEKGKSFTSVQFSKHMDHLFMGSHKRIIFLIGGAYGFSDAVYQRANSQMNLSKMTFSHQMIRLFFLEQLYRGMTILKGEPYHNN